MLDKIKGCLFYKKNELKEIKESVVEMKESIKNIQESIVVEDSNKDENNDIDQEVQEKIKYCRYLISRFKSEDENNKLNNKVKKQVLTLIVCLIIGLAIVEIPCEFFIIIKDFVNNTILMIEIPLVLFILTKTNTEIESSKENNETQINEFIKMAMPLYLEGYLYKTEYNDVLEYYLFFTQPNRQSWISGGKKPDVL